MSEEKSDIVMLEIALRAHRYGICVVPPAEDGTKRPVASSWKEYQRRLSTEKEIHGWYARHRTGMGWVCGAISGGLELFDFDKRSAYEEFSARARKAGLTDLIGRLESGYLEHSPNGVHLFYRCAETECKKLARRKNEDGSIKTLIETKGEGGYAVVAPSNGQVHPTGKPYTLISGGPESIVTITPAEREELHRIARSFDESPQPQARTHSGSQGARDGSGTRPGDDFNAQASWTEVLEGWTRVFERHGVTYWRRPGKTAGISASVNHSGTDRFACFSTSTEFEEVIGTKTTYDKFGAFAVLNHNGDLTAAARNLAAKGYGQKLKAQGTLVASAAAVNTARSWPEPLGEAASHGIEGEHLTDLGNARRLVRLHGQDLRYCHPLKSWFVWDGRRWCRDETDEVTRRAKATVRTIYAEAAGAADEEDRKAIAKWAFRSEGKVYIQNMIALATSEPGIPVLPDSLDADPWVLNVLNGTIDLRTGLLRPHRRDDKITKLAPVEYDPDARSALFDRFLQRAIPGSKARRFDQKAAGCTLLGQAGADKIFIVYGPTRTGKGTFQDALAAALGDYAMTAGLGDFEQRDRARGPQPEIVRLRGARLVSVYETSRRLTLSASLLKSVGGSDPITVRDLYAKPITFLPQFTLMIATNHRPKIPDDDDALWERIVELPFRSTIPPNKRDPAVRAELRDPKASGAAVLAWAVKGCLAYQAEGLDPPKVVEHATQEYREEMDPLREFISDCCVLGKRRWVSSASLRKEYESWCKEAGEKSLVGRNFTDRLRAHDCEPHPTSDARGWRGIGLQSSRKDDT
jgi:putative DNA primase/helicase